MQSSVKKTIITGANRGLGLELAKDLAQENVPYEIILGVRNREAGESVKAELSKNLGNSATKFHVGQIDVSNPNSIADFTNWVSKTFGKIDILIDNAGTLDSTEVWEGGKTTVQGTQLTFDANVYGTIDLTEKLLPYINNNGKIIVLGSLYGKLAGIKNDDLRKRLGDENIKRADILTFAKEYQKEVADGKAVGEKWAPTSYHTSKVLIHVYTHWLSKQESVISRGIQVYIAHPGWIKTDLGGKDAALPIDEGIITQKHLINLPYEINPKFQGQYFYKDKVESL